VFLESSAEVLGAIRIKTEKEYDQAATLWRKEECPPSLMRAEPPCTETNKDEA
jgi:hypothetical protein